MTQEEKAHRYDEAIKVANKYKDTHIMFLQIKDEIFPELAESEDERIRKEMIFYFTEEIPQCSIQEHSDKMRVFISWLKKQEVERTKLELKAGSSYFCYKSRYERADNETFKKGLIYKCNKDGVLDNFVIKNPEQHFIEIKDERIAWLEKQGEKIDVANKEYWRGYREGKQEVLDKYAEFEKQCEQKLYINDNAKEMFIKALERVEEQNNKGYKLTDCDKNSWWEDFKAYTSCTIEQKPTIEMKSAEESLGIDSETYNKIVDECIYDEQKPADKSKIKPKFKTGDRVIGIVSGIQYFITEVCDDHYYTESGCIIMFCSQDNFELYEQKPAEWSEEDDAIRNDLINYFRGSALETSEKEVINWLKSLKDRALPQSKQEWSDVDKDILFRIINDLKFLDSVNIIDVEREINWLKSLRPQNTWKPSDEQMDVLLSEVTAWTKGCHKQIVLESLYNDLKNLK